MIVDECLGKERADDIFHAAMLTGMVTEKQAEDLVGVMEKDAFSWAALWTALKTMGKGTVAMGSGAVDLLKELPKDMGYLALLGAGTGALSGAAYNAVANSVSKNDPRDDLNTKMEIIYSNREKEKRDAEWMSNVKAMHANLLRNYSKMTPEDYEKEYGALKALIEEKA